MLLGSRRRKGSRRHDALGRAALVDRSRRRGLLDACRKLLNLRRRRQLELEGCRLRFLRLCDPREACLYLGRGVLGLLRLGDGLEEV